MSHSAGLLYEKVIKIFRLFSVMLKIRVIVLTTTVTDVFVDRK